MSVVHVRTYGRNYETVAASQTAQVMGTSGGATGDVLDRLWVVPSATTIGAIAILDGATSITVFAGTATYNADLKPFAVELGGMTSLTGPWKVTTGAGATVIAVGKFA